MRSGASSCLRSGLTIVAIFFACSVVGFTQDEPQLPPRTTQAPVTPEPAPATQPSSTQQTGNQPAGQQATSPSIQAASGEEAGRFVFKKNVQEVVLHATVVDDSGRLVTGLDRSAFSIQKNNVPETITSFRREDVPVALGIVVDNSGSMRDKRAKVNQAVLNLVRASNPDDQIFVVNFGLTPYLDQDFTSDVHLLEAALHQVSSRGSTALYDAVVASANHLDNSSQLTKKVLLVVTDGQDNMSRETLQEALRKLQPTKGLTVYAIGLTDEGMSRNGRAALQELASTTGGVAFFPQSLDEVDSITRTIAHDIRSQYTLAFKPADENEQPNQYQYLHVEARAPGYGHLTVRTRAGYYPGETTR
jgi:Ca-activated chloride channel homolog